MNVRRTRPMMMKVAYMSSKWRYVLGFLYINAKIPPSSIQLGQMV